MSQTVRESRSVEIERLDPPEEDAQYLVRYIEGAQDWPYGYPDLDDAMRGIERWLDGNDPDERT